MTFQLNEILETMSFPYLNHFDIRTVTMGLSLRDCHRSGDQQTADAVYDKLCFEAKDLVKEVDQISQKFNIPVANKRMAITPVSVLCDGKTAKAPLLIAHAIDKAAKELGLDFVGGYSALIDKGITQGEKNLIEALPQVLSETERLCSSFNVATTRTGLNLDAIILLSKKILETAELTKERDAIGCAKLVVFANAVEDNPFMAGAFHGMSMGDKSVSVGISGPGVVRQVLSEAPKNLPLQEIYSLIKKTSFKMTRVGELFLVEAAKRLQCEQGIIDISLAPTPTPGDSVGEVLELIGVEQIGTHGTTAALALLNDAIKKGGTMATTKVGGLSGAFIPLSEDAAMIESTKSGTLTLDKLEAMTCVCSVGLDMVAVPGDIPLATLVGIIADECALGMVNNKTTGVRIIPVPGKTTGDTAYFGGLLGEAPIIAVHDKQATGLLNRGGYIPTPVQGFRN